VTGERAGFVSRAGAIAIDAALILAFCQLVAWLSVAIGMVLRGPGAWLPMSAVVVAAAPVVAAVYNVACWRSTGRTVGKWLLGLAVVDVRTGAAPSLGRSIVRFAAYALSALPLYLGYLWVLGPERRGWHDRISRTAVVYARRSERRLRSHPMPASL
jgi:uncharacterized RDD family membrane protein YckC